MLSVPVWSTVGWKKQMGGGGGGVQFNSRNVIFKKCSVHSGSGAGL